MSVSRRAGKPRQVGSFRCTEHTDVDWFTVNAAEATGRERCVVLQVGTRRSGWIAHAASDMGQRYGGGVDEEARSPAQMAAEGSSNKEIAQALFVTVKTVEMHLGRVYRKLELSSRAQLAGALSRPVAEVPATA
jgi:DNA-directed RNA polymerase specialized sigma24 family protein